jgi:hypothetical protein
LKNVSRSPSSRRGLARARSFGLAAFGFAKFLSPFPKRLKSYQGEGESFAGSLKYLPLDLPQGHPQNQNRTVLFLLLGEKVRLRADHNTIFILFHQKEFLPAKPVQQSNRNPCDRRF